MDEVNCVSPSFFFPIDMPINQYPSRTRRSYALKRCHVCGKVRHISAFTQNVMNYRYSICNECYSFRDPTPNSGNEGLNWGIGIPRTENTVRANSNCFYCDNTSPVSYDYESVVTNNSPVDLPARDYVVPYARWIPVKTSFSDPSNSVCVGRLLLKTPRPVDKSNADAVF